MRSDPRDGTGPWGQYKTPGVLGFICAKLAKRAFLVELQIITKLFAMVVSNIIGE